MTSKRPQPKQSSIAGLSPLVAPPAPIPSEDETRAALVQEPVTPRPATVQPAVARSVAPAVAGKAGEPRYPKVSVYMAPERADRARAAYMHTMTHLGAQSFSSFMGRAVMTYVEELERLYNGGEPFPEVNGRMPLIRD